MAFELSQEMFVVDVEHSDARVFTAGAQKAAIFTELAAKRRLGKLAQTF